MPTVTSICLSSSRSEVKTNQMHVEFMQNQYNPGLLSPSIEIALICEVCESCKGGSTYVSAVVIELFLFQIQVRQEQVVFPEAEVLNSNLVKIIKLRLKHK